MKILIKYLLAVCFYTICFLNASTSQVKSDAGLIGYWKLSGDITDKSGNNLNPKIHGQVDLNATGNNGAGFNGQGTWLEVAANPKLKLGTNDFSVAAWINTDDSLTDIPGDIISLYDASSRKGFHVSLNSNAAITGQSSYRQLSFGIDDNKASQWVDHGKPGNALLGFGMAEYKGELYVGTCEVGIKEAGHVYKFSGGTTWLDCGSPDRSNSVVALAVLNGSLYAGTGNYRVGGSSLPDAENKTPGGKVFRYISPDNWEDCGQLPGVETIGGMVVYNGKLYASSMYAPSALYRYEGNKQWVKCPIPDNKRVINMAVYNGHLYATSWDLGRVYRFDGASWTDCGQVGDNTQTYAFAVYEGKLKVATWPSGRVYRFDGLNQWTDLGRLGTELEVMGMQVHNGRLIAGTLPLAEVYSYEGDTTWKRLDQLDKTPDVKYRRAWAMSEHNGKLFCSTLPSGKIYGFEAGKSVVSKEELPSGWQHITAIKTADRLRLFINGKLVNETKIPASLSFDLSGETPLKIGFGSNDYFHGRMREVRLYNRGLNEPEIAALSRK